MTNKKGQMSSLRTSNSVKFVVFLHTLFLIIGGEEVWESEESSFGYNCQTIYKKKWIRIRMCL